ncbi:MAG: protoheme IX farnesyltransferase [Zetaproteobacteria bacterium]|nr:protoheme IX farnesyltransferase [Pseudobdellovibrionaceae bacterium]
MIPSNDLSQVSDLSSSASLSSYFKMTKPTISLLVVLTVVPSLFISSQGYPSLLVTFVTLFGTYWASSSAAMFNHLVDSDIDASMVRTSGRPIPAGEVNSKQAFVLALLLGIFSFSILYYYTTPLAAYISLGANFFYVVVYTMYLKRRTDQNIVIGGAAGAVGPLIGSAAVSGTISLDAWMLFTIIFLWTPPHFWSLAIKYKDDYANVGVPMLPSVRGVKSARIHILLYSLSLLLPIIGLCIYGQVGWIYSVTSIAATLYFIYLSWVLYDSQSEERVMPVFYFSLVYVFLVFIALTFDQAFFFMAS